MLPCHTYLGHSTINNEVGSVDEAALVASEEDDGMSLLNCLAEPTSREVDLAAVALRLVITQPILQKRGAIFW